MSKMTRKEFLRLGAAATTAALTGKATAAQQGAKSPTTVRGSAATTTLIRGADLLTMDPALKEMSAADVLIQNGKIADIGHKLSVRDAEVIDAKGMILMPGMIDGHRHVWEVIDLGRTVQTYPGEYTKYQQWKMRTMVCLTEEDHYVAELIGGLQAIDSGVTSILDYSHGQPTRETGLAAARGLKDSGIGGWFAFQLGVSSSYKPGDTVPLLAAYRERVAKTAERHWETAAAIQKEHFSDSSAPLQFGLAPSGVTGKPVADIKEEWARARGMGAKVLVTHVHKPPKPAPAGTIGTRGSGIADLYDAGLLGPDYHLAHGNRLTPDELKMLRDTGGMICATAMGEFSYVTDPNRGPPVHGRARAAGVPVGMGVDVPLAINSDYFEHVRTTFRSLYLDPESHVHVANYQSPDTLDFATALGAKAIRLGDIVGTITVGKRADLVLLSTKRIGFGMAGTLADRVVTFANTSDIDSVWIAGRARKRDGRMIDVNWDRLKTQLVQAQERIGRQAATITFTS